MTPTRRSRSPTTTGAHLSIRRHPGMPRRAWRSTPEVIAKPPAYSGPRNRHGARLDLVRFKVFDDDHHALVSALRNTMGDDDFDAAWAEGVALSTEEAIAYALRGRGERKRPSTRLGIAHSNRTRRGPPGRRGHTEQGHRHSAVRLTANRADTSPPRLQQARPDLTSAARPGSRTSRSTKMRLWADVLPMVGAACWLA